MDDLKISFRIDLGASKGSKAKEFYAYVHKDIDGNVFYVGKGKGRRAWDTGRRHILWQHYVERLNGKFKVEIVADGLREDEAAYLEADLMAKYGGQLVNWQNMSRSVDYKAYERYRALEKENARRLMTAKDFEKQEPEKAIVLYREALECMMEWTQGSREAEHFTGVAANLYAKMIAETRTGDINILDRLTLCLKRLDRQEELDSEVEEYLVKFPHAKSLAGFQKILKRSGLVGEVKTGASSHTGRRVAGRLRPATLAAIKSSRKLLEVRRKPIDRHFAFNELEEALYKCRSLISGALEDFEATCEQHHSEMNAIRPALIRDGGGIPMLPLYRQMAIMKAKAKDYDGAVRWCIRGLDVYANDALRQEDVRDLKQRLAKLNQKLS